MRRGYPVFDPSAPLSVLYRTILSQSILALKRPSSESLSIKHTGPWLSLGTVAWGSSAQRRSGGGRGGGWGLCVAAVAGCGAAGLFAGWVSARVAARRSLRSRCWLLRPMLLGAQRQRVSGAEDAGSVGVCLPGANNVMNRTHLRQDARALSRSLERSLPPPLSLSRSLSLRSLARALALSLGSEGVECASVRRARMT